MKQTTSRLIILCLLYIPFISVAQDGRTLDSLQLVNLYDATCKNNPNCLLNWNFNQPINTWEGIAVNHERVTEIIINYKRLNGNIPDLQLPFLRILDLWNNELIGTIPNFSNLINLEEMTFGINRLTGTIPDFNQLSNLKNIMLNFNQLTGNIPNFNNTNLHDIDLNSNRLTG